MSISMKNSLKPGKFETDFFYSGKSQFFSCSHIFSEESYLLLQKAFCHVSWKEKKTNFYRQYESVIVPADGHDLTLLFDPLFFIPFRRSVEKLLGGVHLRNVVRLVANKLITSQEIDVHNDYCDPELGYENFRFILQFAKEGELVSGGEISFLASLDKSDIIKRYKYQANSGICFEISPHSHHFVSPVEGERNSLIMYLWKTDSKYDGSGVEILKDE